MFYRNIFEYLESKQNPDNIYCRYRRHKESIRERINAQAAGEFLLNEAATALKTEIEKAFNSK